MRVLLALVVVASVAAIALPATAASARGDGWLPVTGLPDGATVFCGSTPVTLNFPVNREYVRTVNVDSPDIDHVDQFTGSLWVTFTTTTGRSITLNASGPGEVTTYTNGDVETHSEGWFNFAFSQTQAQQLGLPQIVSTTGVMDYVFHPGDDSVTPVRIPTHVVDVCAQLGLG
jgi:hypothetical protein